MIKRINTIYSLGGVVLASNWSGNPERNHEKFGGLGWGWGGKCCTDKGNIYLNKL